VVGPILWLVLGATLSLLGLVVVIRRRPDPAAPHQEDLGEPEILQPAIDPDQPRPPERLDRYLLIDRIGEGGLAEVFTAAAHEPDGSIRPLVVKRLRSDRAEDALAITHFLAEKELGSALVHPNIAAVVDFGEAAGQRFLVEEYISGRDVGRLTRRMVELKQRPLSAGAILHIAHEVLSALEYAHARLDDDGEPLDLVHRDVTPENILVSDRGEVKLLDFGIAQIRGSTGGSDQPEGDTVKGNVDFMSPEQARGGAVDHRADLFSVGLVIYFCAARAPLYRGKTLYDRLLAAATGPGPREWDFIAGLPPPLPDLMPGLLATDPDQRFQTAGQARARLAPHCVGAPAELAEAIRRLFGDELLRERTRLQLALGPAPRRVRPREHRLWPARP
jgi:serine/threonine-protein kinase